MTGDKLNGQQFLMVRGGEAADTPGFVVVLNWFEELTRLVPIPLRHRGD